MKNIWKILLEGLRKGKIFGKCCHRLREKEKYLENVSVGCERRKNIWKILLEGLR